MNEMPAPDARSTNTGLPGPAVALILAPGLLYVGLPLIALLTLFTAAIAAISMVGAMAVPLVVGLSFGIGVKQAKEPLDRGSRIALCVIGGTFAVMAWLAHEGQGATPPVSIDNPCFPNCPADGSDELWLLYAPALVHAPLALLAAATGSRRVLLALLVSLGVLALQAGFLFAAYELLFDPGAVD